MQFKEFYSRAVKIEPVGMLVAFDPGETTGVATFMEGELISSQQLDTHYVVPVGVDLIADYLDKIKPDVVVYEDYRVYGWKADDHKWGTLHTPRLIGCIQTLCYLRGIKVHTQMAQQPKAFCTDDKLKEWGYYKKGEKHARDAIRHGAFYLLFNQPKPETPK